MAKQGDGGDDLTDMSLLNDDAGDGNGDGQIVDGQDGVQAGDDLAGQDGTQPGDGEAKPNGRQDDDAGYQIEWAEDGRGADDELGGLSGDEDDRGGKDDYGKKVRERIAREQRIAREARARAEASHKARLEAEHRALASQKEALELSESAIDVQIKATTSELKKAKEEGKTDDEIAHSATIAQLHARKEGFAGVKRQLAAEEERLKQTAQASQPNQLASEWKNRNPWFGHQRYGEQTQIARAIDMQLSVEGYDKFSSDYYAELNRRLRRRCPELQRFGGSQQSQQQQRQRRDPAGAVVRRDVKQVDGGGKKGVIRLTVEDRENMRNFGIDINDPKAVKEYALNKMGVANG